MTTNDWLLTQGVFGSKSFNFIFSIPEFVLHLEGDRASLAGVVCLPLDKSHDGS
ncbi:MAG: hypothetical protein HC866_22585 [Leptolyngbyaceae cyanobacterium RU_5_1]|nr:hypothetical protein [Leptolyngbyaceae cyanobacterium RU_5_1]